MSLRRTTSYFSQDEQTEVRFPLLREILFHRLHARALLVFVSLIGAVFGVLSPFFQKEFIDKLSGEPSLVRIDWIGEHSGYWFLGAAFVCTILAQVSNVIAVFLGVRESVFIQRRLSEVLYQRMLSFRTVTLGSKTVGEIVSIYATDVAGAGAILEQSIVMGARIIFPLVLAPVAIYYLFQVPLWATLLVMGSLILINVVFSMRQAKFFYLFKQLAAERTGLVNEWIQNIRSLKILGWIKSYEKSIFEKRKQETDNRIAMVTNGQVMSSLATSVTFFINVTGVASLVYLRTKPVSPGEILAMLWILGVFLAMPFRGLPWFFTFAWDALTSVRRLEGFLALQTESLSDKNQNAVPHSGVPARIEVSGLTLKIGNTSILNGINFSVRKGEFVAIVGEVGSGKSTLLLSLLGEMGANFKQFKIGLVDCMEISQNSLRSYFAYIPQEGFVMSSSLRDNVAFEYDTPTRYDDLVKTSLSSSQFILKSESTLDGLNTEIGERGVNLSGGQKQRVGLARADFFDRPIMLLDDCLSAVDVDTEKGLIDSLFFGSWSEKTRILVTHRLSVLEKVDRVFFMEKGMIIEEGKFQDLMCHSKKFRDFVASESDATNPSLSIPIDTAKESGDLV